MLKQVSCWISDECSKLDEDKSPKQQQTQHPPTRAPTRQATACQSLTPEPPPAGPRYMTDSSGVVPASVAQAFPPREVSFLPSHRSARPLPPAGRSRASARRRPSPPPKPYYPCRLRRSPPRAMATNGSSPVRAPRPSSADSGFFFPKIASVLI